MSFSSVCSKQYRFDRNIRFYDTNHECTIIVIISPFFFFYSRWLSTNVEQPVYNEMRDHLTGFNLSDWDNTLDLDEDTPKMIQIYLYYGLLENPKTGIQRVVTEHYLDRGSCELATYAIQEPGSVDKVVIKSTQVPQPNAKTLMMDTYHYMLKAAFDSTVKGNCFGCLHGNRPTQKDHMFLGCLDDRDRLIDCYGKDCHLSITPGRLMAALTVMCAQFKVKNDQSMDSVHKFLKEVDYESALDMEKMFVYEYNMINGL